MNFFAGLPQNTQFILVLTVVAAAGLALGSIKIRGIGLGSSGALFAGLLIANLGIKLDHHTLEFVREFGLILFVFMIGIQLGPGILDTWRQQGGLLNGLAALIVGLGFCITLVLAWMMQLDTEEAAGLYSGAVTNTPSLGASGQVLDEMSKQGFTRSNLLAMAYAVAYPGAIVGIISSMLILKQWLKIDINQEIEHLISQDKKIPPIERRNLLVTNPNLENIRISDIPGRLETGVLISRYWQKEEKLVHTATDETIIRPGDIILTVGNKEALDKFQLVVGVEASKDLMTAAGDAEFKRVVVTNKKILGKSLQELALDLQWGVTVTRIIRSGVEMSAKGYSRIHYGDMLHIVGDKNGLEESSRYLGNSPKDLHETQFIPLFLGISVGVLLGLLPMSIPGIPIPVRLGLAGGPLLIAILVSLLGNLGPLVWYIPAMANKAIREFGIILFLACVGLHAGDRFFQVVFTTQGIIWMFTGIIITMIPLLLTGILARRFLKLNYLTMCGLIAGSMTDPPALAFASSLHKSEAASIAYAAVYPLSMILRILTAQLLVLILC